MKDELQFAIKLWRCAACGAIHVPDGEFDPDCARCAAAKIILSNANASRRRRSMKLVTKVP
jgi:hypothetical protein